MGKELQKRMAIELQPLILESTLAMQKILEANTHKHRLGLLKYFVDAERKRLEAKKTLQGMFFAKDTDSTTVTTTTDDKKKKKDSLLDKIDDKLNKKDDDDDNNFGNNQESTIFIEDPDAFQ